MLLGANFESFLLVIFNPLMSFSVDLNQSFDELRMFFSKFSAYRENKVRLNQSLGCCDRLCAAFISLVNAAGSQQCSICFSCHHGCHSFRKVHANKVYVFRINTLAGKSSNKCLMKNRALWSHYRFALQIFNFHLRARFADNRK